MRALLLVALALLPAMAGCFGGDGAPPAGGPHAVREDTKTFTLPSRESIEWKFRLADGARLDYDWRATRAVYFDFHSDHDDGTDDFVSHKEAALASDAGTFTAPFDGRHGWYFQNRNAQTVTITLHTTGAYEVVGRTGGSTSG